MVSWGFTNSLEKQNLDVDVIIVSKYYRLSFPLNDAKLVYTNQMIYNIFSLKELKKEFKNKLEYYENLKEQYKSLCIIIFTNAPTTLVHSMIKYYNPQIKYPNKLKLLFVRDYNILHNECII